MESVNMFIKAAETKDVETFMRLMFPKEWAPIIARIIESGVEFSEECEWAPRWSNIPLTKKTGKSELEAAFKSCMYRIHDCFHQLWGLPIPQNNFSESDYYIFKRAQMCGEVAVLTLSEFILSKYLYDTYPEIREMIQKRCAIQMMEGPLKNKTPHEIAMRLDDILHKKNRPKWLREHIESTKFADYYVPMLEWDRQAIDHNWKSLKDSNFDFHDAPNSRYSENLDGLELTLWMITDFYHLLNTDCIVDKALANFNRERRKKIVLPESWGKYK